MHQYDGRIDTPFPRVPGHDFAGRVDAVGDKVPGDLVGAAVAVKPSLPCGQCAECSAGKPADCSRKKLMGLWSDGCLTERVAVPAVNLVPRPEGVAAWQDGHPPLRPGGGPAGLRHGLRPHRGGHQRSS